MITKETYMVRCKYFNDSNSTCNSQEYGIGNCAQKFKRVGGGGCTNFLVSWTSLAINKQHLMILKD